MSEKVYIAEMPEVRLLLMGKRDNEERERPPLFLRTQGDGTLRTHSRQVYIDESGNEAFAIVGANGQQFVGPWVFDYSAGTWRAMAGDSSGVQYTREFVPSELNPEPLIVAPYVLTNAWAVAWAPGAAAAVIYKVEFEAFNFVAAAVTFGVARDIGAAGAPATTNEYWTAGAVEPLPVNASSGRRGPFYMAGNDQVIAICSLNASAKLEFIVRRVK